MIEHRSIRQHAFQAFLIVGGLAPALLCAEAITSPTLAQKAVFERNKPHVNVGTIDQPSQPPTGMTTEPAAEPAANCCENIVGGVRDFKRKPAGRVQRRTIRIRPKRR